MRVFDSSDIRNVALIGHGHCGKTSLAAGLLHTAGVTDRLLRVDEGNTVTDFDEEEMYRKLTITSAVAAFPWQKTKINLFDTPGYNIFLKDTRSTLTAADASVVLLDGVAGIEVSTEKVWQFAEEFKLPCAIFVNKLDRERSSFDRVLESVREIFGRTAVPIHLPVGSEKNFNGIIDLIRMRSFCYKPGGDGKGKDSEIPTPYEEAAAKAREALVEMVAEGNDELMEEFFASGTLPADRIVSGLQQAVRERRMFPILCGAALQNIGSDLLMNFIGETFPSPLQSHQMPAFKDGSETSKAISSTEPPSVFVFKTSADPFAGRVTYFKVMSGTVKDDAHLTNMRSNGGERLAHIATPFGKTMQPVTELRAGDIGVVAKLKDTLTGDTLCEKTNCAVFKGVEIPEPSIAYAISAKTRNDEDRLSTALAKMLEEDRSLRFYRDPQTKEFLLAGNGQQHVEIVVSRLKRRYGVEVELKAPKIPYRETVRGSANVQGRHKKQTGGHGQFGDCWIRLEPLPRGEKFQFINDIFGGSIPKQYIPAVEKGIVEAAEQGFLAGYPVTDFKVTVYDGSYHEVDSSEMAFKLAGRKAFRAAMQQAKPALLEPIMKVEVETPTEFAGDLMSDFNGRRGRISGMDLKGNMQTIRAQVPMSEMLNYQNDLISKTQGRASFHMEFDHYDYVPAPQAEKIIAAAKAHLHVEEEE
ncbi:MAG: elongation factor G [Acidobacteriaceae bacterium]|nr:elongation factor G [Acidobacteriaceae bacterium]MBV9781325.1 elongation factor G [Acidobacteriaceae bacterium]